MTRPPRLASALLAWRLDPAQRDDVIGDLDEQFQTLIARRGRTVASWWYYREAIKLAWSLGRVREAALLTGAPRERSPLSRFESIRDAVRESARVFRSGGVTTAIIVASLAMGIGANTAIFSIVDSLALRPLPVAEPDRLVQLVPGPEETAWTNPLWEQIRARTEWFDGAAAWSFAGFNLAERGESDPVSGYWVSGAFFDVLGVRPALGRLLTTADDVRSGATDGPVAVVSHAFWRRRLGGTRDAIGKPITLDRMTVTVVGVTPPEFFGPEVGRTFDVMLPLALEARAHGRGSMLDQSAMWWLFVIARLKAGASPASLEAAIRAARDDLRAVTMPADMRAEERAGYFAELPAVRSSATGQSYLRTRYLEPLTVLMATVAVVLLMACVNIANLLLARADTRRHEFGVRFALGASRGRLVRQLLLESAWLSGAGAVAGLLFAYWGSRLLIGQISTTDEPVFLSLLIDWRVLGFTAAMALTTALLVGAAPAVRATRSQPLYALQQRSGARATDRRLLSSAFVVAQVALSLVLVVAAGLLIRSFTSLSYFRLGFDPESVLAVTLSARPSRTTKDPYADRARRILEAVRATPGAAQASFIQLVPTSGNTWTTTLQNPEGLALPRPARRVFLNRVSPGSFETMGTRVLSGRDFEWSEIAADTPNVVINETLARRFFPGRDPVGLTVREAGAAAAQAPPMTVIGVVEDAIYSSARDGTPPTMYRGTTTAINLIVRARSGPALSLKPAVAAAIARADPDFVLTFRPLSAMVGSTVRRERVVASLSGFFGAVALLVAGLGVYGVIASAVSRRQKEIGLRRAIGATGASIALLIARRGVTLVAAGLVVGIAISFWTAGLAETLMFGVGPRDPATFAGAALLLFAVALAAMYVPARRAARLDPARILREG
jgi:predicted permease